MQYEHGLLSSAADEAAAPDLEDEDEAGEFYAKDASGSGEHETADDVHYSGDDPEIAYELHMVRGLRWYGYGSIFPPHCPRCTQDSLLEAVLLRDVARLRHLLDWTDVPVTKSALDAAIALGDPQVRGPQRRREIDPLRPALPPHPSPSPACIPAIILWATGQVLSILIEFVDSRSRGALSTASAPRAAAAAAAPPPAVAPVAAGKGSSGGAAAAPPPLPRAQRSVSTLERDMQETVQVGRRGACAL